MANRTGELLGNYRLTQLLGKGGFAEVYLGEHIHIRRQAAIKVLQTRVDADSVADFQREAQIIAELHHPSIISILDFALQDGVPFLVMDYCPEGSLRRRHPCGTRVPLENVVAYAVQIAEALQYAHEKRLIHRDVKPENMLIGAQGEILLSDFGVATIAHSTSSISMPGFAGTPYYMAPEQIREHPRPASDQYALATVVYEWLTGATPFRGTASEVFAKQLMVEPASLCSQVPGLAPDVERVVLTALSKDPLQRFATVRAFATALATAARAPLAFPASMEQTSSHEEQTRPSSPVPHLSSTAILDVKVEKAESERTGQAHPGTFHTAVLSENRPPERPRKATERPDAPPGVPQEPVRATVRFADITKQPVEQFAAAAPVPHKRARKGLLTILSVCIALLCIGAGVLFITSTLASASKGHLLQTSRPANTGQAAVSTPATSTATPGGTPSRTSTPPVSTITTATPGASSTPAYPGYLPGHGQLAVYDPITPASNWEQGPNNDKSGYCEFSGASYHATMNKPGYRWCYERLSHTFSNFVYQIKVTIMQGDCAGVFFRHNSNDISYTFVVCQAGTENLYTEGIVPDGRLHLLQSKSAGTALKIGLNQTNLIAVAAQGSSISLFINKHQVAQVQDSSSAEGSLGVASVDQSQETNAMFRDATIWTL